MKKRMVVIFSLVIPLGIFFLTITSPGCKRKVSSSVKNSFSDVTSRLDEGGQIYVYVSTERMIQALDNFVQKLKKVVEKETAGKPENGKQAVQVMDFIYGLLKKSGLMEISGVGLSSVAVERDLNHSKLVVHHYIGQGKGIIWRLCENKPHRLDMLDLLPADTAAAGYVDFKFAALWDWLKQETNASAFPSLKQGMAMAEISVQLMGMDFNKMKSNLSNGMGFVLTLDKRTMRKFPSGGSSIEIPDPGFAVVVYIQDDYLFKLLQGKMPRAKKFEEGNIKRLRMPIPMPDAPITWDPVIAQKDNLLIFATANKIVDAMFAAQEKGDGLTATAEFKRFSKNIPEKGNSFRYQGTQFSDTLLGLIEHSMKSSAGSRTSADNEEAAKFFSDIAKGKLAGYGVGQNTTEGFVLTLNHALNLEQFALLPAMIVPGIVAAVAVPNFLVALQKGKTKSTMAEMKSIGGAVEAYIIDHHMAPAGNTLAAIQPALVPVYIKVLPLKDGWGNDFLYKHGTGKGRETYFIASPGKDGVFNGWEQAGYYPFSAMLDFNNDMIFSNGIFTYGPGLR